jgi:hypothetical protein
MAASTYRRRGFFVCPAHRLVNERDLLAPSAIVASPSMVNLKDGTVLIIYHG